jgi:phage baseplate assembly protein V
MTADIAELTRLLNNLIRLGTIAEVDYDAERARVRLGPKLVTTWRPWVAQRAGNAKTWWAPCVDEQVVMLSPGGDLTRGLITLSLYSEAFPAPSHSGTVDQTDYPDGAYVQYDHANHALAAILPAGSSATLTADSITANAKEVTSNAPNTKCTGDLAVDGNLIVSGASAFNGGVNAKAGASGKAMTVQGSVEATEDVVANGVSLCDHDHDVLAVGAPTSKAKRS